MKDTNRTGKDEKDPEFDIDLDTLQGDIRDVILMQIRDMPKAWQQTPENQQRAIANRCNDAAARLVRQVVHAVTTFQFPTVGVQIGDIQIKPGKGIIGKFEAENITTVREILGDYAGTYAQLVMADPDQFSGEKAPADIQPDQGDIEKV